ncbi:ribosome-associated translation inhibitor RaiA [Rothia sp. HC945]|uniref:ribosome hibernation-promoting factor, HPF/YfiA family n=1 Tax=Rothia sp. HC945 TaxID=3171170 RepID=UPI00264E35C7|nr:ribosome-associated translation inhibitor RaiA [Kocuria sp.]MDN5617113.1 ribosome-associated translation inhibitor RaiA [Kocuria sp.]
MELNVYGRNVKVPDRFREYAEEKVEKFEKLNERVDVIDIKVSKVGNGPQAMTVEITVQGKGPVLRAEAQGSDKFAVFEDAYSKLLERLRRARDRRKIHRGHHRPVSVSEATGSIPVIDGSSGGEVPIEEIVLEKNSDNGEGDAFDAEYPLTDDVPPVEIRRKTFPTEKITVDQAVDRMELVGHDFYLFVDAELDQPAAVYRRKGWTYGVIVLGDDAPPEGLNETRLYKSVPEG